MRIPDCISGYGHDWIEATTHKEAALYIRSWLCPRCDTLVTVNEAERVRLGRATDRPPSSGGVIRKGI